MKTMLLLILFSSLIGKQVFASPGGPDTLINSQTVPRGNGYQMETSAARYLFPHGEQSGQRLHGSGSSHRNSRLHCVPAGFVKGCRWSWRYTGCE